MRSMTRRNTIKYHSWHFVQTRNKRDQPCGQKTLTWSFSMTGDYIPGSQMPRLCRSLQKENPNAHLEVIPRLFCL